MRDAVQSPVEVVIDLDRIAREIDPDATRQADMLLWHGKSLFMTPLRDPVPIIAYSAQSEGFDAPIVDDE